ncbi:MAG: DNA-binding protein [Oscillospiraceae bacterium]|nr:DNA-binding protein [Oscillospiraceae bacterium]
MSVCLGIDTSNYTTSAATYDSLSGAVESVTIPLPVPDGALGLRQSDALFHHVKQLPEALRRLDLTSVEAIGVSSRPRGAEGSYMPCFLAGDGMAEALAHALGAPLYRFSHQEGHIAAAAWSAGAEELPEFLAWHLSGGTTELLRVNRGQIEILAATKDISAGQLIDRVGLMLGLPFPSGGALDRLALKHDKVIPARITSPNLSGFENKAQKLLEDGEKPENIAFYIMNVILQFVINLTPGNLPLLFTGGVSRSEVLRSVFKGRAYFAEPRFSSDNALGAAYLAAGRYKS